MEQEKIQYIVMERKTEQGLPTRSTTGLRQVLKKD